MTNPDQPQNGTSLPPAPSYAPIRAQIAATLSLACRDHDTVTEICLIVAAIAHGTESAWLQARGRDLGGEEAQQWLQTAKEIFAEEIAGVLHVSQTLDAYLVACGLPGHLVQPAVNVKLALEFFELPAVARRHLGLG